MFQKDALRMSSTDDLVVVELAIHNRSDDPVDIIAAGLTLRNRGQPLSARVVSHTAAEKHLRGLGALSWATDGTFHPFLYEQLIFLPLSVALVPQDYCRLQGWKEILDTNRFDFGTIQPNQDRHGFVYFDTTDSGLDWNSFFGNEAWGLDVAIEPQGRQTLGYTFDFGKEGLGSR